MPVKRDFSRKLPKPIGPFKTLASVRDHILALDNPSPQWLHVGAMVLAAAEGGEIEDVVVPLNMLRVGGVFE